MTGISESLPDRVKNHINGQVRGGKALMGKSKADPAVFRPLCLLSGVQPGSFSPTFILPMLFCYSRTSSDAILRNISHYHAQGGECHVAQIRIDHRSAGY